MEHLLLEVAAAPLRLIAAKNEKSRSELGRFLVKRAREGTGGKEIGPSPHRLARTYGPARRRRGPESVSCHSGPLPKAGQWRGASARI